MDVEAMFRECAIAVYRKNNILQKRSICRLPVCSCTLNLSRNMAIYFYFRPNAKQINHNLLVNWAAIMMFAFCF